MKPVTPPAAHPLSPAEQRWLDAFRAMDDECRYENLCAMEGLAKAYPRHTKPALRVIAGGAS